MQDQLSTNRMQLDNVSSIAVNTLGAGAFGGYGFTLLLAYLGIACAPWLPFFVATALVSIVTLAIYRENPIVNVAYQSPANVTLNLAAVLLNMLCLINIVSAAVLLTLTLFPLGMPVIITITAVTWLTMASCYLRFHRQTLYALWQQEQNKTHLYHLACLTLFCIVYAMVPTPITAVVFAVSWLVLGLSLYVLANRATLKRTSLKQVLSNAVWQAMRYTYSLLSTRTFWLGHVAAITKGTVYGITSYLTLVTISTALAGLLPLAGLIAVSIGLIAYLHQRTKLIAEAHKVIFPWNKPTVNERQPSHSYTKNNANWLQKLLTTILIVGHFIGQFAQIFVFALDPISLALTLSLKVVVIAIVALITAYTTTRYYGATLIADPLPYQEVTGELPNAPTISPWTAPTRGSCLTRGLAFALGFFIFGPTIVPGIAFMCYQRSRQHHPSSETYISVWSIQGGMGIFYGVFGSLVKGALPLAGTTTVLATVMSPHIAFAIGIAIGLCIAATQGLRAINQLLEKFCEVPANNLTPATDTNSDAGSSYDQVLCQLSENPTLSSISVASTMAEDRLPQSELTHASIKGIDRCKMFRNVRDPRNSKSSHEITRGLPSTPVPAM